LNTSHQLQRTNTRNQEDALSLIGYQGQFQLAQRFGTHLIAPKPEHKSLTAPTKSQIAIKCIKNEALGPGQ